VVSFAPAPAPVVVNPAVKRRLIFNARVLNLWLGWLPFSYERLQDRQQYLVAGDTT
jgi:hypothetical protein